MYSLPRHLVSVRPTGATRSRIAASSDGTLAPGVQVRVKSSVIVYHVPKTDTLDLEGLEGEISADMRQVKGTDLTANMPWKVKFEREGDNGKASKFFAHLTDEEIEAI
ncbi:hypothetical protein BSKO_10329 [Bryopsis sp. KO-2023]|nr:hypothetical protein BSKO_10329 [Bryopsis sp. KO-2023]